MLNKKLKINIVQAIFMSFFMSFFMSLVMTYVALGWVDYFFMAWMRSFFIGFVVSIPIAIIFGPISHKTAQRWIIKD